MDGEKTKKNILKLSGRIYAILEFSPTEVEAALDDFRDLNQSALAAEIVDDFSEKEVNELNEYLSLESGASVRGKIEELIKNHCLKREFAVKANEALESVWQEYVAFLKNLGNVTQKEKIDEILAGS